MTIDTSWLKEVCADPVLRPSLSKPMTFDRGGMRYTVATDGHRMVELPGNDGGFEPVPASAIPSLHKIVQPTPASAVPFNYAALKAFVTDELKDMIRACLECDSTGLVPQFRSYKNRGPDFITCPRCHGAVTESRRAYVGGVLTNLRLWEPVLANLPNPRFPAWYQESPRKFALVDGLDWRFFVMPLDENQIDDKALLQTYHRFEIPGAQARAAA